MGSAINYPQRGGGVTSIDTTPTRVHLLGDSLTMRSFRVGIGAPTVLGNGTDVELPLGSGATLPPPGSTVRVINQSNQALNIDVPVVGSGTNSVIFRYPFAVTGLFGASATIAIHSITNDSGWWQYAEGLLGLAGKPVQVVRNGGDGGDTLQQMRARIGTEIAPSLRPGEIVVVMGGVNGAGNSGESSLDGSTAANAVAEWAAIIDQLRALGAVVVASTITQAQSSAYWAVSPATALANTRAVNGYLRGRALSDAGVHLFDSHVALGGGDYANAGMVESNGIHYLPAGALAIGQRFVADCGALFGKRSFRRVLSVRDAYVDAASWNLLVNPEFAGATGTTPPTGWTAALGTGTNTLTLAARADGIGNDLTFYKSVTGANGGSISQDITARVQAGQRLVFGTEFESGGGEFGLFASCSLEFDVGGVTYQHRIGNNQYSYASGGRLIPSGVRLLLEHYSDRNDGGRVGVVVPNGFTAARFVYRLQIGAAGDGWVKFGRPHVYQV